MKINIVEKTINTNFPRIMKWEDIYNGGVSIVLFIDSKTIIPLQVVKGSKWEMGKIITIDPTHIDVYKDFHGTITIEV